MCRLVLYLLPADGGDGAAPPTMTTSPGFHPYFGRICVMKVKITCSMTQLWQRYYFILLLLLYYYCILLLLLLVNIIIIYYYFILLLLFYIIIETVRDRRVHSCTNELSESKQRSSIN